MLWRALPGLWRLATLIVAPAGAIALGWGLLHAFLLLMIDTDYASGYSRRAFESIELGFSEDEVIARLGEPLDVQETEPDTIWVYSDEPLENVELIPSDAKKLTRARFGQHGLVLDIFDAGCGPMGAGQVGYGYLGLEIDRWETLVGTPMERFRELYGEPSEVKESQTVRVLRYSIQSPASMDYRIRNIELDRDGRVVGTVKDHYGD